MKAFKKLEGIAAPMPIANIDTDMIIPKQFLKTIKRTGLGKNLFDEMRYDMSGKEIANFILNQDAYRKSEIIVADENFGCGSSREHAPWALLDFGIRCIIAPSFADIFYNNCFKNGILPVVLKKDEVNELIKFSSSAAQKIQVDLPEQKIIAGGKTYSFEVDSFRKHCLLNGLDDIGLTLEKVTKIDSFEAGNKSKLNWLYNG